MHQNHTNPNPYVDTIINVAIAAAIDMCDHALRQPLSPAVHDAIEEVRASLLTAAGDVNFITVALARETVAVAPDGEVA